MIMYSVRYNLGCMQSRVRILYYYHTPQTHQTYSLSMILCLHYQPVKRHSMHSHESSALEVDDFVVHKKELRIAVVFVCVVRIPLNL